MTQTDTIYNHLRKHGSITPLEALNLYGIMRTGARIWDLKRMGVQIDRLIETHVNQNGETKRYARYYLKGWEGE